MKPAVPFVNLDGTNEEILDAALTDIRELAQVGLFTGGGAVLEFEDALAAYTRQARAAGTSSGLDAIRLALLAIRSSGRPRRRIIVPAMTFVATWEAVVQAGFVPLAVDVLPDGTIDPEAVAAAAGPLVRGVVPVHLYGQMADMAALEDAAGEGLLIEDAAQAFGAERDGVRPGDLSAAVAYSFYPTKPLGAWGDAGAVTTNHVWLDVRVRQYREHGKDGRGHPHQGYTARLDAVQAVVLARKLEHVDRMRRQREEAARRYLELLHGVGDLELPVPIGRHAWHLYAVRTSTPNLLAEHLRLCGVGTGRHYSRPVHLLGAFQKYRGPKWRAGAFPNAERIAAMTLSLPLWPGIQSWQQEHVADAIRQWFDGRSRVPR